MATPVINNIIMGGNKKYALDYIPGAYPSCVAFFSYFIPSARYKGFCCRVKRLDTGTEKDIGYINGYIDYVDVSVFCAGTTGLVTTIYNSSGATGKQDAIQTTVGNMPIIYESGAFLHDGFKFVAANSKYISCINDGVTSLNNITFCANFIPTVNANKKIITKPIVGGDYTYAIVQRSAGFLRSVANSVSGYVGLVDIIPIDLNVPTKIICNYGNNKLLVYKNAVEALNINTDGSNIVYDVNYPLGIGVHVASSEYFDGNIKTIAIFNGSFVNINNAI